MRKTFPALLAVGLVPALVVVPTVSTPKPKPHPVAPHVHTVALAGVDRAALADLGAAADPEVLTPRLTTGDFQVVGVTWNASDRTDGLSVQVRLRDDSGTWSDWEPLEITDLAPDRSTAEAKHARHGTEPLVTGPHDGIQVRVDTADGHVPAGLKLDLIDPGSSAADDVQPAAPASSASAAASMPTIITRAQWGADESLRSSPPQYMDTIKVGFVHHTDTSNAYTQTTAAAQIRGIYAYHTKALGWSDIGYNFLVDKFGNLYEGRYGGITKAVRGAHTAGFNDETFAVSALGCFDSSCSSSLGGPANPSSAMIDSIARLMAWKLGLYYRNPAGSATLVSDGIYATNVKYPAGTKVTVKTISAHRDQNATSCPGSNLYPYVHNSITTKAVAYQGATLYNPWLHAATLDWGSGSFTITAGVPKSQSWTLDVLAPGSSTPIRTLSGTASSTITATWDGKTSSGALAAPGAYRLVLRSGATYSRYVEVLPTASSPKPAVRRLFGDDRFATAVAMGREAFPTSKTVVVVNGETAHLVDGLVSAPLARAAGGPVLLTNADSLPQATLDELQRRGVTKAYLVGGSDVVSDNVAAQLTNMKATVTRLDGVDRYATAANVAREVDRLDGGVTSVVVASGDPAHLIDAAAAGGPAAATGQPILLVQRDAMPAATSTVLGELAPKSGYVLGTTDVVSDAAVAEVPAPQRLGGTDRYATASKVADAFAGKVSPAAVAVASGADRNLVDSLAGGAMGRITLLSAPTSLPSVTSSWIGSHSSVAGARLLGGDDTMSPYVMWSVGVQVAK